MSNRIHAHHRSDPEEEPVDTSPTRIDPVCGMEVEGNSPLRFSLQGEEYLFCSSHCREAFRKNPARYLKAQEAGQEPSDEGREEPGERAPGREFTCPMHPEVVQDGPGSCPKCGMALEPMTVTDEEEEDPELRSMTLRLWVCAVLSVPVVIMAMPGLGSGWGRG